MKLDKRISDSYKSADIPQVDLERKIINQIKIDQKSKRVMNFRSILVTCLILVLTTTMVFAISRIVTNEDGSHTLMSEDNEAVWTIRPNTDYSHLEEDEASALKRVLKEINYEQRAEDEGLVAYLNYDNDKKPIFAVLLSHVRFQYNDQIRETLSSRDDTPDYMLDVLDLMEEDFSIISLGYQYQATPESEASILEAVEEKAVFGEVYTDIVKTEKDYFLCSFNIGSKNLDKLRDVHLTISESSTITSGGDHYNVGFESMEIKGRTVLIGENNDDSYEFIVEVNGIGVFLRANPMGDLNNMVEIMEKYIDLLETYELD